MQPQMKLCPKCGQTAFLESPHCVRCGRKYRTQFTQERPGEPTQKIPAQPKETFQTPMWRSTPYPQPNSSAEPPTSKPAPATESEKLGKACIWAGWISAFLLLGLLPSMGNSCGDSMAKYKAEEYVKWHLKAPSSANFCSTFDQKVTKLQGGGYRVRGWVEAQNAFGAMLREYWRVDVSDGCHAYDIDMN